MLYPDPFKLPYQSQHPYKDQIKLEVQQCFKATTTFTAPTSSKGNDTLFLDVYQDAQDRIEPDYEEKYLKIMEEEYLQRNQSSDKFDDYDEDYNPMGPW